MTRPVSVPEPALELEDPGHEGDEPKRTGHRKRNRRVLIAAVVMLLVPIGLVGGYVAWLSSIAAHNVKQAPLLPNMGPVDSSGEAVPQPRDNGTNYLIVGSDARAGLAGARSDVMVIAHVPQDHGALTLIHFPRDLWVSIPGHGKAKLNAAYAYGQTPLLVQTMQNLLGIKIDHVAAIDFEGFKRMTDAVGGVRVKVEEPSERDGFRFTQGMMQMDGEQALAFVRERKQLSQGDISRGERQLAFIKALTLKSLSKDTLLNPLRLKSFIDAATKNLTVDEDLDVEGMRSEAFAMRNLRGDDVRFITAPFVGFGRSPDGQSIDVVDVAKMTLLGQAIKDDALESYR